MLGQISFIVLLAAFCIVYLKINENFYQICKISVLDEKTLDNLFTREGEIEQIKKAEKIKALCKDFYVDYSNHTLMKNTLGKLDDMIYNEDYRSEDLEYNSIFIKTLNSNNVKLSLLLMKLVHIVLYGLIMYLITFTFPNLTVQIITFIFNKLLFIVFLAIIIEAILKFYTPFSLDIFGFFSKDNNFNFLEIYFVKKAMVLFKNIVEILRIQNII